MKKATLFTIVNYVLSAVLWLLGILTLLFNLLGLWMPWLYAGWAFVLYIPVPAVSQFLGVYFCSTEEKKLLTMNLISFGVSASFVLLTVFISSKWFW